MKKNYVVNADGVAFAMAQTASVLEEGAVVELELSKEQETALVAAGWIEPTKKKAKEEG